MKTTYEINVPQTHSNIQFIYFFKTSKIHSHFDLYRKIRSQSFSNRQRIVTTHHVMLLYFTAVLPELVMTSIRRLNHKYRENRLIYPKMSHRIGFHARTSCCRHHHVEPIQVLRSTVENCGAGYSRSILFVGAVCFQSAHQTKYS